MTTKKVCGAEDVNKASGWQNTKVEGENAQWLNAVWLNLGGQL